MPPVLHTHPPVFLLSWLRRAQQHAFADRLILSGSFSLAARCEKARVPKDIDYLVLSDFDPDQMVGIVKDIAAIKDGEIFIELITPDLLFYYTEFPGLRVHLAGQLADGARHEFVVDFAFNDPLSVDPTPISIPTVGDVRAIALETLFAWKLHGLVQFGPGGWRAKDLYDMDVLWSEGDLDRAVLREAMQLAFTSRGSSLDELYEFRTEPEWGLDDSGRAKWAAFEQEYAIDARFQVVRSRLRDALNHTLDKPAGGQ